MTTLIIYFYLNIDLTITLIVPPVEVIELLMAVIGLATIMIPILRPKKKRKRHKK